MKKWHYTLLTFMLFGFLVACGGQKGVTPEVYKQIQEGMSQPEVEELAGQPAKKETNNPYDVWIYDGQDGIERSATVRIEFSKEGQVLFKSQKKLFEAPKAEEKKYNPEGELKEFITAFNNLVSQNEDVGFLQPISTEGLDFKRTTFYDGQGTVITVSDPAMINDANQYSNKIHFEIEEDGTLNEIYYIGADLEYPVLVLHALNVSEETMDEILTSYKDIDVETLESKSFNFNEGPYSISIKNGSPKTLIVTKNDSN
ncbi:outer membrane protein assembly factor BamE [Paenibacillus sp. ACRRY]|uniref:outer membrane protein assembly factor BamE n=1 Tax=Paenibacillus sp. ACRRY TaxID=2918208 RepID=UPI001EF61AA0|nr:outer membrane protein assembly factor BamE [Paenibacillus sp. ACRRY]MCG7382011.1 outer membrane protein assembly factor BamE [Paenibacillus sp. ACRRY]